MGNDVADEGLKPKKSLECAICGKPSHSALMHVGAYCSNPCKKELMARDVKECEALLAEPVDVMPEEFDLPAFERYALKVAVHMIATLPPVEKARWVKKMPMLLVPGNLADEIKAKSIPHIPLDFVSALEANGHERFFYSGTYQFKKSVPKEVIIKAMVEGRVFRRPPEKEDK
jgi:hypothetical protein